AGALVPAWASSPGGRLLRLVQPDVEEVVELLPRDLLGEYHERRRAHVAVAVPRRPGAQKPEEVVVADLLPERLQRHRAAVVDRPIEHVGRAARVARRRRPEPSLLGRDVVVVVEVLLGGLVARVLAPDPLRPGREALVQPDVGPGRQRD